MNNCQLLHRVLVKHSQALQSSGAPGSGGSSLVSPVAQNRGTGILGDTKGGWDSSRNAPISGIGHKLRHALNTTQATSNRAWANTAPFLRFGQTQP